MLTAAVLVAVVMVAQASHLTATSYHYQGAPSNNEAYVNKVNTDRQHYVNRIAANVATGHASYHHHAPSHYRGAPSNNEAYVNKVNAARQLYVNRIAAKLGTGAGTGFLDGVPGTPLSKDGGYKGNLGNYAYGGYSHGYGYPAQGHHYGGYGYGAYGNGVYGTSVYGIGAYGGHHYGHGPFGAGHRAAYGPGYGYGARYSHGKQDNAFRQHQVNLIALHQGAGVGTTPLYGVPGTRLAANKHKAADKTSKAY